MSEPDAEYDALLETVSGLAEQLSALNRGAEQAYAPIVEDIIRTRLG